MHIENYQLVSTGENGQRNIIQPTWHLNDQPPSFLRPDLATILRNLLEFSEDLLVAYLTQHGSRVPVVFYEIPEHKRDKAVPVRLGLTLDMNRVKLPTEESCELRRREGLAIPGLQGFQ